MNRLISRVQKSVACQHHFFYKYSEISNTAELDWEKDSFQTVIIIILHFTLMVDFSNYYILHCYFIHKSQSNGLTKNKLIKKLKFKNVSPLKSFTQEENSNTFNTSYSSQNK